ncbi:hypothetical protein EYZ11_011461 [Aspergillus tanneri]|uniref:Uncharacterized protein n=1 Tax=Aspergillus tanneri TaxID=1220188 RepID=A0A4V3UMY2_9EURO|nr:uncharacterized protein ATNIH1004_003485 [Aspergillus tanneri]KAA8650796.1 hypothetical protein ATNIH1004_003485 [Aspergillus tanneri]THC89094.1 hypothetical protein EYZ11_011461 [Aspergillus tanneri]
MTSSATPSTLSHSIPTLPFASKLSEQLSQRQGQSESRTETETVGEEKGYSLGSPLRPSPKSRSLSDAARSLSSPRPNSEDKRPSSKDDTSLSLTPETPQRLSMHPGLSLNVNSKTTASPSLGNRTPLSPKLDSSQIYGCPGSVLPRRSRGLDFSRACTNLHHSTLAESSPDSSPVIGGRGMSIPQRRGSPGSTSGPPFSTSGPADKTAISSSVSSVNMMESDTSSSEEDDETMEKDDMMIINTPQANKISGGPSPFAVGNVPSPGNDWMGGYSQAATSLMSFQRARFRKGRGSRQSSSSASGNSSKPSPGSHSPPVIKSIENQNGGYFGAKAGLGPRRESLSLGTRDLRLSDLSDEGETRGARGHSPSAPNYEGGPLGVIRRAVTRRGSLLPKTKTFARIRAALLEETAPIDSEAKREAEVIRQVRESEPDIPQKSPSLDGFSFGNPFQPAEPLKIVGDLSAKLGASAPDEPSFSEEAHRHSGGPEFWNSFDERYRTPPPTLRRPGTSVSEDDLAMDITPAAVKSTGAEFVKPGERPSSRSSTPYASHSGSITEFKRKRQREDDFDPSLFKRRAVSPSLSVQSSPVMPNSPVVKETGSSIWGPAPKSNLGSLFPDRPGTETPSRGASNTVHTGTLKRVGLQGMTEANDGFMNMSIE